MYTKESIPYPTGIPRTPQMSQRGTSRPIGRNVPRCMPRGTFWVSGIPVGYDEFPRGMPGWGLNIPPWYTRVGNFFPYWNASTTGMPGGIFLPTPLVYH